ncbi:ferrochelatase [Chitinivorax tropicus]|uniref:Ferrochelatase n=1 Tax=Chitinivorax tropicus TaxID=714531 RepID=A0A840MMJ5_9PROT|nr:ferrochelatase [Chitinivorax tropicus]MBB5019858.1 ferrochelatase [Chitinivorax tropicus]
MKDPFLKEPAYTHGQAQRIGVLLINLGSPAAPTKQALKPYLREFLSDQRIVELPGWLWQPILRGIILNTRPKHSAEKYAAIWTKDGSPLKVYTERLAKLTQGLLGEGGHKQILVSYAMRYGQPAIATELAKLKEKGCERILLVPLYPQYAASSTGSALDACFRTLLATRNQPEIRTIKHFHDAPGYIESLANSVRRYWAEHGQPSKLVMSFHGIPKFALERGDPYHCECLKTGRLLAEALGLTKDQYEICFQSRFGRAEWLQPYLSARLEQLGKARTERVDVICPGFVADCLETLEEVAMEGKATFLSAGGKDFHYIPCLNDNTDWVTSLTTIIQSHLSGWLQTSTDNERQASRQRALSHGAHQ